MTPGRALALCLAVVPACLAVPGASAGQTPPDTVRPTVDTLTIRTLFRERASDADVDPVEGTVPTPEVEAIFRTAVEVTVETTGDGLAPDEFMVRAADVTDSSRIVRQTVAANGTTVVPLDPGEYTLSLDGLGEGCRVSSMRAGPYRQGVSRTAAFAVACREGLPVTVDVFGGRTNPADVAILRMPDGSTESVPSGSSTAFLPMASGPNRLVVTLPDAPSTELPPISVELSTERSDVPMIVLPGQAPQLIEVDRPATFALTGGEPVALTLMLPEPAPRTSSVVVTLGGELAERLGPGSATVQLDGGEPRSISVDAAVEYDNVPSEPIRLLLSLDEVPPSGGDGWHLGGGLGAIGVAATGPTSFVTPTVSLSLVRGDRNEEWLYLTGHLGYWRAGPSAADPVLPADPRPPFRNRTIWTWSVGASLFLDQWAGLGISAAWVEGRETATAEEKYMNRSRGVALGPRFRVRPADRWPYIILGLDVQYGETEELRLDEPELGWSLTPSLSLSYVLH